MERHLGLQMNTREMNITRSPESLVLGCRRKRTDISLTCIVTGSGYDN